MNVFSEGFDPRTHIIEKGGRDRWMDGRETGGVERGERVMGREGLSG